VCAQYARLFVPFALARKDFTKANLSALLKKYAHACASSAALPPFVSNPTGCAAAHSLLAAAIALVLCLLVFVLLGLLMATVNFTQRCFFGM
jgi:hypothetical protein